MRVPRTLRRWVRPWIDFILPQGCLSCGGWIRTRPGVSRHLCPACVARIPAIPSPRCSRCDAHWVAPYDSGGEGGRASEGGDGGDACQGCADWPSVLVRARAVALHRPPADALVHALKYEGWGSVAEEVGPLMARHLMAPSLQDPQGSRLFSGLVPIPTTASKARVRGYNQAERLADVVSRSTGIPVVPLLERVEGGTSQIALSRANRLENVEHAFRWNPAFQVETVGARRWVLVDDVLTTGATAGAAARVLEAMGILEVELLVWARTPVGRGVSDQDHVPTNGEFRFIERVSRRVSPARSL